MRTIRKYPLKLQDKQLIVTADHPKILTAQVQDGIIMLWAEVSVPAASTVGTPITILVYGTGNQIQEPATERIYISTVQLDGYVWHIYQLLSI